MSQAPAAKYRTAQDKVTRGAVGPVLAVLNAVPVGAPLTDEQWAGLLAVVYPPVQAGRVTSAALSADLYATLSPSGTAPALPPRSYDLAALSDALTRTARDKLTDPTRHMQGVVDGASAVSRHIELAGRDYTRQATFADEDALGWARVARGMRTCAFCLMLISRGPVYRSAANAGQNDDGTMNRWHDRCDCQAVPVFDRSDWPGRDQYLRAGALYAQSTYGTSGVETIRAFRRAVDAERRAPSEQTAEVVAAAPNGPKAPQDVTDAEMEDALQAAIEAEDWDRFEALSAESDERDALRTAAEAKGAKRAQESAARSERRRQQKDRERAAQLDLMVELIERGVSEAEAYAQAYGKSEDDFYRERAVETLRGDGYQGSSFDKLARQAYRDYVYRQWQQAEDDCRGHLLTAEAQRRGIDDRGLFSGPLSVALKHASEELRLWWEENGRMTFDEFAGSYLGDNLGAQRAALRGEVVN